MFEICRQYFKLFLIDFCAKTKENTAKTMVHSTFSKTCLGKNLEALRKLKKWSREEMARQLQRKGASAVGQTVANWESGKNYPNAAALEAYKEIFPEYEISSKHVFNMPLTKWEYEAYRIALEEANEKAPERRRQERREAFISFSNALDLGVEVKKYIDEEGNRAALYTVGADTGRPPQYKKYSCTPEELDAIIDNVEAAALMAARLFVSTKKRHKPENQF